jgi:protein O-GlcNAc transferase
VPWEALSVDNQIIVELATKLLDAGHLEEAAATLGQLTLARQREPNFEFVCGRLEEVRGQPRKAISHYRRAVRSAPGFLDARLALASLLTRSGEIQEAIRCYQAVIRIRGDCTAAWQQLCWLKGSLHDFDGAYVCINHLERLQADHLTELGELALGMMHICDWSKIKEIQVRLVSRVRTNLPGLVDPYAILAYQDDPEIHLQMARCIAAAVTAHVASMPRPPFRRVKRQSNGRLRVGYLGGDFNQHATSLLLAGILEEHDRRRFSITLFDYSFDDRSDARARILAAADNVVVLYREGPAESAAKIAATDIDILVDVKGYTQGTHSEIMALRPAPIQVSFLGYVGTQGGDWIDYVIADRYVLPLSTEKYWRERIVHMPHSYYPNDRSRPIPRPPTPEGRAANLLPDGVFVFACFNSPHKITSSIFGLWMRLLREISNSVLWLYESNEFVAANLRAETVRAGVRPSRLVFGRPMPLAGHIDRHAYADLFLDTSPYGAHTTAADALWAGVPVITFSGQSFPSRVGASLLHAIGLPELICETPDEYFALAFTLARDPVYLEMLRQHLVHARQTSPLFDATCFPRDLEHTFVQMAATNLEGRPPAAICL